MLHVSYDNLDCIFEMDYNDNILIDRTAVDMLSDMNLNLNFWCLTPLSAILQLYHGNQF